MDFVRKLFPTYETDLMIYLIYIIVLWLSHAVYLRMMRKFEIQSKRRLELEFIRISAYLPMVVVGVECARMGLNITGLFINGCPLMYVIQKKYEVMAIKLRMKRNSEKAKEEQRGRV